MDTEKKKLTSKKLIVFKEFIYICKSLCFNQFTIEYKINSTIYEKMLEESKWLESQIASIQSQINSLPDGNFFCCKNGKYYKWYHTDGKCQTIIPKQNRVYAQELAKKRILSLRLDELQKEKEAMDAYLEQYDSIPRKANQLLNTHEEYRRLLITSLKPTEAKLLEWMKESYPKNTKYPERLIYKTISGSYVRSKSEVMIDTFLMTNKIPYRYECGLHLGETLIYPDFTIRHPQTGKVYYWEHFGRMDDVQYAKNAGSKLQLYISHGIIPSIQLITTYETSNNPLSAESVDKIVHEYFL